MFYICLKIFIFSKKLLAIMYYLNRWLKFSMTKQTNGILVGYYVTTMARLKIIHKYTT